MTIENAAQKKSILKAALAYVAAGCSILPVQGKRPARITLHGARTRFPWTSLQKQQPQRFHVEQWARRGWLQGIGLICGAVSGNLVVIDLDGQVAVETFKTTWHDLYHTTYRVVSGSLNGMHIYVYADVLPPSVRATGFELRADGCYVVAPPSRHPDTEQQYQAVPGTAVKRLSDVQNIVDWISGLNQRTRQQNEPPVKAQTKPAIGLNGYGRRALDGECHKVRQASEGYRNNQLNLSAFRLGQLVAAGYLPRLEVEAALYSAAIARGLPDQETRRTIASGLGAGSQYPRFNQ